MLYEQKVKYMEYREDGAKVKGAGFVKMECWGESCHFLIQISGLSANCSGERKVYLLGRKKEILLGEIRLEQGRGRLELQGGRDFHPAEQEMNFRDAEMVRIPIAPQKEVVGFLKERSIPRIEEKMVPETSVAEQAETDAEIRTNGTTENKQGRKVETEPDGKAETESGGTTVTGGKTEGLTERKSDQKPERKTAAGTSESGMPEQTAPEAEAQPYVFQTTLQPHKWEQLYSIYPKIRPFGDDREYLRISPGDFVIFKDKSYHLANNSFLLHGYFNYKHLILHRTAKKGENAYFVGVPGNFYDKEKEVAILFGFESFECEREPAREGDYGYYMMRVEL